MRDYRRKTLYGRLRLCSHGIGPVMYRNVVQIIQYRILLTAFPQPLSSWTTAEQIPMLAARIRIYNAHKSQAFSLKRGEDRQRT